MDVKKIKQEIIKKVKRVGWTNFGVVVSVIALILAWKSYSLSSEQYKNSQIAIYRAEETTDGRAVILKPYSDSIYLQLAGVYLPSKLSIDNQPFRVNNGDYTLYLHLALLDLEEILRAEIEIEKGYVGVMMMSIPMIIDSNYIHNGVVKNGVGLYHALLEFTINEWGGINSKLKNIVYEKELNTPVNIYKILDEIWNKNFNDFIKQNMEIEG